MRSTRGLKAFIAAALMMTTVVLAPSGAGADHNTDQLCPGENDHAGPMPEGLTIVDKDESGADDNGTVLDEGTIFCVKASTGHTGVLEADGVTTLQEYLFNAGIVDGTTEAGRDVSHWVLYGEEGDDPLQVNAVLSGMKTGEDGDDDGLGDGLSGWTIAIFGWDEDNETVGDLIDTVTTDNEGAWTWTGPDVDEDEAQKYVVCEVVQDGWTQVSPGETDGIDGPEDEDLDYGRCWVVEATGDEEVEDIDFANHPVRYIGGSKYFSEQGGTKLQGWEITVTRDDDDEEVDDEVVCETETDEYGDWVCGPLDAGSYTVTETLPTGTGFQWVQLLPADPDTHSVLLAFNTPSLPGLLDFVNECQVERHPGGRTIGFWQNKHGENTFKNDLDNGGPDVALAANLAGLSGLNLRNGSGAHFNPTSYTQFKSWLKSASASNMQYMLSAQMAATWLNTHNIDRTGDLITSPGFLVEWTVGGVTTTQSITAWITAANAALADASGVSQSDLGDYKDLFDAINNDDVFGYDVSEDLTDCDGVEALDPEGEPEE
jgi:hypothetical protein